MRIKNVEIESFINFLMGFELRGRDSRMRTRFTKLLMKQAQEVHEENMELIKQYSVLDDEGIPEIIEVGNKKMYNVKDKASYNKEYFILMNEDFVIEENEERKEMLMFIKSLILNCEMTFKNEEALEYDRWCEIVEEIDYKED